MMARKTGSTGLWEKVKNLFTIGRAPEQLALSFAVGVLSGMAPCYTGPVILAVSLLFLRINKVVAVGVMALFLATPLVFVMIAAQFWLGLAMMREPAPEWIVSFDWELIWLGIRHSHRLLAAYVLGGFTMSFGMAGLTYGLVRWLVAWRLARKNTGRGGIRNG
jgi:uncharacterized protein (DUF2062 family)